MKSFLDLGIRRRSVRKFTDVALTEDEVVELMKPVLMSPSSMNYHSCQFIIVNDKVLLHQLSECKPKGAAFIEQASIAVVVVGDSTVSEKWIEDTSIASTILLFQAEDMGLGACWVQIRKSFQDDGTPSSEFVHEILDIPDHLKILSIIAVGNKAHDYPLHDLDDLNWEKIHFNKF